MMKAVMSLLKWVRWGTGGGLILTAWWIALTGVCNASESSASRQAMNNINSPDVALYREECGACHMAYPAKLLPAESWKQLMGGLTNHFGENAEIETGSADTITHYLMTYSGKEGKGILKRLTDPMPLQITELPYFKRKHREIPERLVSGNPEVGNFNDCSVCHAKAVDGVFDEDTVDIPGYGRWDD